MEPQAGGVAGVCGCVAGGGLSGWCDWWGVFCDILL